MASERSIVVPRGSSLAEADYAAFLDRACDLFARYPQYFAPSEGRETLELAHLLPHVAETVLAIYVGINDAVCNKGLVTALLPRHGHNMVFAFDPSVWSGGSDVPDGTSDARQALAGFEPPNATWPREWTYVMLSGPARKARDLWREKGYIDMIPAKFEDFTMLSDPERAALCVFVDPRAFDHPVNAGRPYLAEARRRGDRHAGEFAIPEAIADEADGLVPVMPDRGEKLYIASPDFGPCQHCWSSLHRNNTETAVVNEISAVPLDLLAAKPPMPPEHARRLTPPGGSADMTTDWFRRGTDVVRTPILPGAVKG